MIKSISYDQGEIIKGILDLHVPNHKIDCDSTLHIVLVIFIRILALKSLHINLILSPK